MERGAYQDTFCLFLDMILGDDRRVLYGFCGGDLGSLKRQRLCFDKTSSFNTLHLSFVWEEVQEK